MLINFRCIIIVEARCFYFYFASGSIKSFFFTKTEISLTLFQFKIGVLRTRFSCFLTGPELMLVISKAPANLTQEIYGNYKHYMMGHRQLF